MSNDIIQELEMDLTREKEKLFLHKNRYNIIILIGIILLGVIGYQYYQVKQAETLQNAADDYYNFTQFYDTIEKTTDVATPPVKLLPKTITDVPSYFSMSELIKFNNAQKNNSSDAELLTITNDYLSNPQTKPLTIHDSILKLFNLSLKSDTVDFKVIEPEFIAYLKHPFAFKAVAYDMLFLLALDAKNAVQARHYLKELKKNSDIKMANKIKIYETHPLLQDDISSEKTPIATEKPIQLIQPQ
jgi:hypothetical protein